MKKVVWLPVLVPAIYFLILPFPIVRARIRLKDDELTVFPDSCDVDLDQLLPGRPPPISSDNCGIHRLDKNGSTWLLRSDDGVYTSIPCTVPGDILTDLREAGIILDPYKNNNFLDQRHVWMGEDRVKANGTKCYKNFDSSRQNQSGHGLKDEYRIPNLEVRTRTWIYETKFVLDLEEFVENQNQVLRVKRRDVEQTKDDRTGSFKSRGEKKFFLVVEGIKMGASVSINGTPLGNVTDQFLRNIFPISQSILRSGTNLIDHRREYLLSIAFDPTIDTHGRFMACSGGWDWAPYSKAAEISCSSRRVFSFGIFQPIYIAEIYDVAIVHVVPKIRYKGDPTIEYLKDGKDFELVLEIHVLHHGQTNHGENSGEGQILIRAPFMPDAAIKVKDMQKRRGEYNSLGSVFIITTKILVSQDSISLWWPHGVGSQTLYTIHVAYKNTKFGTSTAWFRRQIGFRSIALITYNEYHQSLERNEGTGDHGFYFKINGLALYARGANVVPSTQFEGRMTDSSYRILVQSAAAANMNMLRVWGGGMILPKSFYDACDQRGIMLYHDLMFVEEQYHGVEKRTEVEDEIRYIVRQLSSHPSIVIWNGCNECNNTHEVKDLYSDFAMPIVSEEDGTRPIWGSSPSNGWKSGVRGSDQLPNGRPLTFKSKSTNSSNIEDHGPYNHGVSNDFSSVNGHFDPRAMYDSKIPFVIKEQDIGLQYKNKFISEFGMSSFPSFESMHASVGVDNWGLHGSPTKPSHCFLVFENLNECVGPNIISQRNYPCDRHIKAYFGDVDLVTTGKVPFQKQLLQCMLSQALWMKGQIEILRSINSFGSLIWQLNENWPTGGWGAVEYGSYQDEVGQVVGGRWKPLMHLLERFLFRDVFASCGIDTDVADGSRCFVRNDGVCSVSVMVAIEEWNFNGTSRPLFSSEFNLGPNGDTEYFSIGINNFLLDSIVLEITVFEADSPQVLMGQNVVLWKEPKDLTNLALDPGISILSITSKENRDFDIVLHTEDTALYVGLTSTFQGRFDDNWFSMKAGSTKSIRFIPFSSGFDPFNTSSSFIASLRIEHIGMALKGS